MSQTMLYMLAALGAEIVLLLIAVLTVSFLQNRAARRRDQKAMQKLVARLKSEKPQREQVIEQFLSQNMGLVGEALATAKVDMLRAELVLLQRFAGIYRNRDAAAAARFDGDLVGALEPYHALTGSGGAAVAESAADEAIDSVELERLRKDNARLEDELRITMETMSRMLNEYSTMFAGGQAGEQVQPVAAAQAVPDDESPPDVGMAPADVAGDADMDAASATQQPAVENDDTTVDESVVGDEVGISAAADPSTVPADPLDGLADEGDIEVDTGDDDVEVSALGDPDREVEIAAVDDPEGDIEVAADDDLEDLFADAVTEPVEAVADMDGSSEADEEEDPIEQILREAQSQERMARGDAPLDAVVPSALSASRVDEGDVEVATIGEELFDDAEVISGGSAVDPGDTVGHDDLFDIVDDARSSNSRGQ